MRNRIVLPYLILLLGFCFTVLVYYFFSKLTTEQDRIRFDRAVQEIQDQVQLRIATSTTLLRALTRVTTLFSVLVTHTVLSLKATA